MLWLAWMHLPGTGVEKDRARAEELCRQAVEIPGKDREYIYYRMYADRDELRGILEKLEAEWEDGELREKLKRMRLRLNGKRKKENII